MAVTDVRRGCAEADHILDNVNGARKPLISMRPGPAMAAGREWAVRRARYISLETVATLRDNAVRQVASRGHLKDRA